MQLYNRTNTEVDLRGAEMRYYFTADGQTPRVELSDSIVVIDSLSLEYNPAGYISIKVTESTSVGADDFLLVRFTVTGGVFDQTNDGSWDPAALA